MTDTDTTTTSPTGYIANAAASLSDVLAAIDADQHGLTTPCEDMDVAQLAEHVVMVMRRIGAAGRAEPVHTWPIDAADVAAGEWATAFDLAAAEAATSWADVDLDRPTSLPWGEFPAENVLGTYTSELLAHTWDLATTTGQAVAWDDATGEFALAAMHEQLPVADRTPIWAAITADLPAGVPWRDPFGPAVPVADDAPVIDRLLGWTGRDPATGRA